MAEKIEGWKAFDGEIFDSEHLAVQHEREITRYGMLMDLVDQSDCVVRPNVTKFVNYVVNNWNTVENIVWLYKSGGKLPDLSLLAGAGIWLSRDGTYTHINTMNGNHLSNAYRIVTEEKRVGYQCYKDALLQELKKRGLRKEVVSGTDERQAD